MPVRGNQLLVQRWNPSESNLADRLTQGTHPNIQRLWPLKAVLLVDRVLLDESNLSAS
jgi:hypothetical protein